MRTVKMIFATLVVVSASHAFASENLPCNQKSNVGIKAQTNPKVKVASSSSSSSATSQHGSK